MHKPHKITICDIGSALKLMKERNPKNITPATSSIDQTETEDI